VTVSAFKMQIKGRGLNLERQVLRILKVDAKICRVKKPPVQGDHRSAVLKGLTPRDPLNAQQGGGNNGEACRPELLPSRVATSKKMARIILSEVNHHQQ